MIVLYIILGIILFLIGVLSIPINIYASYDGGFVMYVRWLFIKYYIYPPPEKKDKKKKSKKKKKEKPEENKEEKPQEEPKPKSENFIKVFYNNQGVAGIIDLISDVASALKKGFHSMGKGFLIRRFKLRINVADGGAAGTALKYGKVCAAVYPPLGYIFSVIHSRKCSVKIEPDFIGTKSDGMFDLHLAAVPSVIAGGALMMCIRLGIRMIKVMISNSKAASKQGGTASKGADNNKTKIQSKAVVVDTADMKGGNKE